MGWSLLWMSLDEGNMDDMEGMESKGDGLGVSDFWLSMLDAVDDPDGESGLDVLAASMGLFSGDTALELNVEEDVVDGEELLTDPEPFLRIVAIVSEMVCLAACFALSVETKLLTRSLRFPFTSGEASSSRGSTLSPVGVLLVEDLLGKVADLP